MQRTDIVLLALLIALALTLTLPNLGNQYLWQDEAQTALISLTILAIYRLSDTLN